MKKIFLFSFLLISAGVFSQDSAYNNAVKFNLTDSVENGITFQRKAFFEAMIYNQRVSSIALQYTVEFYSTDGTKKMRSVRPYSKEVVITNNTYVVTATGVKVGTIDQVLALYGKPTGNPQNPYTKLPDGRYDLTIPCMGEYDYLTKGFDNTQKLHATIKNIGQREATAGNL